MSRHTAIAGRGRGDWAKGPYTIAAFAFVAVLSLAFWTGAVWLVQQVLRLASLG